VQLQQPAQLRHQLLICLQQREQLISDQWHKISDIITHKRVKGAIHYYVKWALGGHSWVAENEITQPALDAYYEQRAQRARKRRIRGKYS